MRMPLSATAKQLADALAVHSRTILAAAKSPHPDAPIPLKRFARAINATPEFIGECLDGADAAVSFAEVRRVLGIHASDFSAFARRVPFLRPRAKFVGKMLFSHNEVEAAALMLSATPKWRLPKSRREMQAVQS